MKTAPAPDSKVWFLPLALAMALDGVALTVLVSGGAATTPRLAALGVHLLAVGAAAMPSRASRSQRTLMVAFTLTLPLVGALVAMVALATRRRGEVGEVPARAAPEARTLTVADVHRLTDGLSACESLMSGSPDERSATVGMLTRHPDAAAIALLRRAVAAGDSDAAVEAALALEDLGAQLEIAAAAAHRDLDEDLGFERVLADADMLATAVHSGLPEASLIAPLVADARRGYARAAALRPQSFFDIAVKRERLELDVSFGGARSLGPELAGAR